MTWEHASTVVDGGAVVALAVLVHWRLARLEAAMSVMSANVAALLEYMRAGGK